MQRQNYFCYSSFTLKSLNYTAAAFHLIQAAIVLGVIQHLNHRAETNGNTHGLTSGLYSIKKSFLVIKTNVPNVNYDELWSSSSTIDNGKKEKCSQNPLDIYNMSEMIQKTELSLHRNISARHAGALNIMMTSAHIRGMLLNEKRDDIYMFDSSYVIPQNMVIGNMDIRYIIFSFFLLSGLFQLIDGVMGAYSGEALLTKPRILRFVEYSFSASIMILAIAVQVGITDIYVLCCMFALIFTTNILGFIAEIMCCCFETLGQTKKIDSILPIPFAWLWTVPHFLGWITCLVAYAPLLDSYLQSTGCSDRGPPGFVHVIVFLQFVLFSSFGFVQLYSLYYRTEVMLRSDGTPKVGWAQPRYAGLAANASMDYYPDSVVTVAEQADFAYIMLSFIAKTLLSWLILSPVLMDTNMS